MEDVSVFKWVSFKEILFLFVSCSVLAFLLRSQDTIQFKLVLNITTGEGVARENYANQKFPLKNEKLPLPIVTDLESDGQTDIILISPDRVLHVYTRDHFPSYLGHHGVTHTNKNVALSKTAHIVAMTTGFLQPYQSVVQVRKQVIAVLYSDWTLSCYNNNLKLMWSKKLTENKGPITSEGSLLVSAASVKTSGPGVIIIGGRITGTNNEYGVMGDSEKRRVRRGAEQERLEHQKLESLGHYCTYAVSAKAGELLWKHEPGDFEVHPAYDIGSSSFTHFKLLFHKYLLHHGEVSWHQYSSAIRKVMPHFWTDDYDTKLQLSHFSKDRKRSDEPAVTDHITKVSGLAMDHIAGYAFGGLRPHSPDEHVHNPNVLVVHTMKGIEVLHLSSGHPLFSLPLSSTHAVHGDINADGVMEHVNAVINPGEEYKPGDVVTKHNDMDCFGQAVSGNNRRIFRHSICKATHWTESFIATEKWIPKLNQYKRKKVNHGNTEPITPLLIESPSHQHPLKVSSLRRNSSFSLPVGVVYDSIFLLSSGRVTSIGPRGQFNWQTDTEADWDFATDTIYSNNESPVGGAGGGGDEEKEREFVFASETFRPSVSGFSLKPYGKKEHVLLIGWHAISVLDATDGSILVEYTLSSPPISKPVVADFTDDSSNDIILYTGKGVIGLSLVHRSGFLHSTVLSLFIGFIIVLVAVYTRQRTGFLMPRLKEAQD